MPQRPTLPQPACPTPRRRAWVTAGLALLAMTITARAAGPEPDMASLAAQRAALAPLAKMDGLWRGPARMLQRDGTWRTLTQTERVGPMLDGTLRVVEGRGHEADGRISFNALGVIGYDPAAGRYTFRAWALGQAADHRFELTPGGFIWTLGGGGPPVRYTATLEGNRWHELGELVLPGRPPVKVFEMTLERVGNTDWPAAGAPGP